MARLMLVRYLYESGVEQSRKSVALSGLAILAFHDAIELFLQAALEHKGGSLGSRTDFLAYWPALESQGISLSRQEAMRRLNRARVNLKHDGTLPAHRHVDDFRETVGAFLDQAFPLIFGLQLSDVSLSRLVKSDKVREILLSGEQALANQDYQTSVVEASKAFNLALIEYARGSGNLIRPGVELSPFLGSPRFTTFTDNGHLIQDRMDPDVENALRDISRGFGEQITVLAYHLDFEGYRYLKSYGPIVYGMGYPDMHLRWGSDPSTLTKEIAARCLQFAIDAALRLEGGLPSQA